MSKARRIRKISVFTSGGKFFVFTLSYVNTALNQSAFRIRKCYILKHVSVMHSGEYDVYGVLYPHRSRLKVCLTMAGIEPTTFGLLSV